MAAMAAWLGIPRSSYMHVALKFLCSPEATLGLVLITATAVWWGRRARARATPATPAEPAGSAADGGETARPSSLLRRAIIQNDTDAFSRLTAKGATASEKHDVGGDTALHTAAKWDRWQMAIWLLANGADAHAGNDWGFTPLHCAASSGSLETARALLAAGASKAVKDKDGRAPHEVANSDSMRMLCGGAVCLD